MCPGLFQTSLAGTFENIWKDYKLSKKILKLKKKLWKQQFSEIFREYRFPGFLTYSTYVLRGAIKKLIFRDIVPNSETPPLPPQVGTLFWNIFFTYFLLKNYLNRSMNTDISSLYFAAK